MSRLHIPKICVSEISSPKSGNRVDAMQEVEAVERNFPLRPCW